MGTDIEAAVIAAALGVGRPCAGSAIADAALGLEGAVAGADIADGFPRLAQAASVGRLRFCFGSSYPAPGRGATTPSAAAR